MTYEIYRYIFIGGAVLSGIFLSVSILLFFLYKIPNVIGDLSGANERKAVQNIRNQNEWTGDKVHKSSIVNRERGRVTDKISQSGKLIKNYGNTGPGAMETEKIGTRETATETTVLQSSPETTVLTVQAETTVLSNNFNETTVLSSADLTSGDNYGTSVVDYSNSFVIEYEITYIHTNEVIV